MLDLFIHSIEGFSSVHQRLPQVILVGSSLTVTRVSIATQTQKSCLNRDGQETSTAPTPVQVLWSYANPSAWPSLFPSCGGSSQSPINISPPITRRDSTAITFSSDYLTAINSVEVVNNGRSVETTFSPDSNVDPVIRYNDLFYR